MNPKIILNPYPDTALIVVCKNHPHTETGTTCIRCDQPMCWKCAVHIEVGYACQDCLDQHQQSLHHEGNQPPIIYIFSDQPIVSYLILLLTAAYLLTFSLSVLHANGWFPF